MNETSKPRTACRRRLWPRRNELMRPADWIEAALRPAVLIVAQLLMPIVLAVGSETYADQTGLGLEQSRTRHEVTATLLADAAPATGGGHGEPGSQ